MFENVYSIIVTADTEQTLGWAVHCSSALTTIR